MKARRGVTRSSGAERRTSRTRFWRQTFPSDGAKLALAKLVGGGGEGVWSRAMQAVRDQNFEPLKKKSFLDARDTFRTYCEVREDKCVFLVHVPELRRFNSDAQQTLGQMAWLAAQGLLEKSGAGKSGRSLAVGLRGLAAYDCVLTGQYLPDASDANTGILRTFENLGCERELQSWFAAKTQPANEAAFELMSQTNGNSVQP